MDDDKPFECTIPDCGMKFINEDHLEVHRKKHDLSLSLTPSTAFKASFFDQTPTPTRFLNALESELFQDLPNDNPFEATFRRANSLSGSNGFPEPSTLNSNIADSEPLNTPSITLTNETDIPLFAARQRLISLKKPVKKREDNVAQNANESDNSIDAADDNHNLEIDQSFKADGQELSNGFDVSTVAPTSVITSVGVLAKPPSTCMPTAVVASRPNTCNVNAVNTTLSDVNSDTRTTGQIIGDTLQPVVQSVTVAPMVQLIIRMPDGQSMPLQFPAVINPAAIANTATTAKAIPVVPAKTISAPVHNTPIKAMGTPVRNIATPVRTITSTLVNNANPIISSASILQKGTSSPSVVKMKLKQVLTTQKKVQQNGVMNHNHEANHVFFESPPSSPVNVPRSSTSGRRRRESDDDPEEKRLKSLERNRAAATRCRQKRKVWVQTLGSKADELAATNAHLQNEVNSLRNEVALLKTTLLAHKDCPVTQQQKASGFADFILPGIGHTQVALNGFQEQEVVNVVHYVDTETNSSQSGNVSESSEMSMKDR